MRTLLRFPKWLFNMARHNPEHLLALLITAQSIQEERASLAAAFRAGVRIGRKYPDVADKLLDQEIEWYI